MNENESNKRITFELHSLVRDVIRNIWLVVFAAVIGVVMVYVASQSVYKPVYTSSATLIVNVKAGTYQAYTNLSASTEMATIFTEVFVQPTMKEKAAEHLGKDAFESSLTASALTNTNIITLSATADDPELAYRELRAVIEVYPTISDTIFSNAVLDVVSSPEVPKSPSNTVSNKFKTLAAGGMALLVFAAIVILSLLRDTVKDESSYNKKIGSKLLGTVVHERRYNTVSDFLKRKKSKLLINNAFSSFAFSESYQKITARLEYLNRTGGDKVFLVTSVAANEGKSTASVNIALALAGRGKKVALLDMDFMKPSVNSILDMNVHRDNDLGGVLSGKIPADKFALKKYKSSLLYVGLNAEKHLDFVDWINTPKVDSVMNSLRENFDYIIIDTPPLTASAEVPSISRLADKTALIVRTDYVQTGDINDAILMLDENEKFAGCILNDAYKEFSFFGQFGADETSYVGKRYGAYAKYASPYTGSKEIFGRDSDDK